MKNSTLETHKNTGSKGVVADFRVIETCHFTETTSTVDFWMDHKKQLWCAAGGQTQGFGKFTSIEEAFDFVSKRGEVTRARKFVKEGK